ncbi:MAG: MotA/TolQ/ExbB proton channel family protein [Pseudomonadota bacterium]|nr:MotA/TolQ/ExbB proton channel family protein [Pseudomonadota bacterium]
MLLQLEILEPIVLFIERGGDVLLVLLGVIFVMWGFILERLLYLWWGLPRRMQAIVEEWRGRGEHSSWSAHQIRSARLAAFEADSVRNMDLIKALVSLCPLFGLLGTVTGMIEVFDVMASMGTGSVRAMASGISKATMPTMAGMVGALTGVFAQTLLKRSLERRQHRLNEQLTFGA